MLAPGERRWAYLVAGFTEGPPILLVEALPGQLAAADTAREALGVVLPLHGLHGQLSGGHSLVAEGTDVCGGLSPREADRLFGAGAAAPPLQA